VIESMALGTDQLDHFNLLGVVANPRASSSSQHSNVTPSPSAMSSQHGTIMGSMGSTTNSSHQEGMLFDTYGTYNYMESTLTSVTGQIEALNHVFEDWSRHYLNDYYYQDQYANDTIPESQLQELPLELLQLDLSSLQQYLQQSGVLAQTYKHHVYQQVQRKLQQEEFAQQQSEQQHQHQQSPSSSQQQQHQQVQSSLLSSSVVSTNDALLDIPELFFQSDFDLSDPRTFRLLLLNETGPTHFATPTATPGSTGITRALQESTQDLFVQIPPPDHFTGYLDKVEIALLEQVREKSEAFFQETNQFAQLKEWVGELLTQVQRLRHLMEHQTKAIQSWQHIPQWDRTRKHLMQMEAILDGAHDILTCKQCIGGLLSAKDDLGAVEQIQYARRLLSGGGTIPQHHLPQQQQQQPHDTKTNSDETTIQTSKKEAHPNNNKMMMLPEKEAPVELGRLQALRTVGEQLNQYESLVVTSLTEEVVEIFLEWNTSNLATMYGTYTTPSTTPTTASHNNTINSGTVVPSSTNKTTCSPHHHEAAEQRTLNIVASLQMCHALGHMTHFYGTRLHDMVRMTVRTTVGEFASDAAVSAQGGVTAPGGGTTSVSVSVAAMSLERFLDCLDMLFEQLLALLTSAAGVDEFCQREGMSLRDNHKETTTANNNNNTSSDHGGLLSPSNNNNNGMMTNHGKKNNNGGGSSNHNNDGGDLNNNNESSHDASSSSPPLLSDTAVGPIVASAAELSAKSIAELLRLRKEVHSLVSLDEMRRIWDICTKFIEEVEKLSGHKCVALRSMLLTQAKAFVERKHDSNMTALAAALDSERWTQCEVRFLFYIAEIQLCDFPPRRY
jgi:vacuolar protein sorting-associated protein 54